jgi:hypothetical protein
VGPASPFPGEQWSKLGTLLFQHVRPITATITQAARGPEKGETTGGEKQGQKKGKFLQERKRKVIRWNNKKRIIYST